MSSEFAPLVYGPVDSSIAVAARKARDQAAASATSVATMAALMARPLTGLPDGYVVTVRDYAVPGDCGGGAFIWQVASIAAHVVGMCMRPTALASNAAGRWVRQWDGVAVAPEWFGARTGINSGGVPAANVVAINAAAQYCRALQFRRAIYCINDTLVQPAGSRWVGAGLGKWPLALTQGRVRDMEGTILLMVATPSTTFRRAFMSDMRVSGGWVPNPASQNANDAHYKLLSFQNEDADPVTGDGATPRPFTVALHQQQGRASEIVNIRLMLSFNGAMTAEGHTRAYDWDDFAYTDAAPVGLGSVACDIGILVDNQFSTLLDSVEVVGYWRMAAIAQINTTDNDVTQAGFPSQGSEYCSYVRCTMQGLVGFALRGADVAPILDLGADWIEIPWVANHTFNRLWCNGQLRGVTKAAVFDWAVSIKIGNRVRLMGVTPNPVTNGQVVGNTISPSRYSQAISNTIIDSGEVGGLWHASLERSTHLVGVNLPPSKSVEVSGRALRGLTIANSKLYPGLDDTAIQGHDCANLTLDVGTGIENFAAPSAPAAGCRVICSPSPANNTRCEFPAGQTQAVFWNTIPNFGVVDLKPTFAKVFGFGTQTRFSDAGLFEPGTVIAPPIVLASLRGISGPSGSYRGIVDDPGNAVVAFDAGTNDFWIRTPDGNGGYSYRCRYNHATGRWTFFTSDLCISNNDGVTNVLRSQAGGDITADAPLIPLANKVHDVGRAGKAWRFVIAGSYYIGDLVTSPQLRETTSNSGPEGSLNGNRGSIAVQQPANGTPAKLYFKPTGDGTNGGWFEVPSKADAALAALLGLATAGLIRRTGTNPGDIAVLPYDANTFTPTFGNSVPGDLSVSYATQTANYTRIGNQMRVEIDLLFTPTWTVAPTGVWRVGGFPAGLTPSGTAAALQVIHSTGISYPSGRTMPFAVGAGVNGFELRTQGSGAGQAALPVANIPSGTAITLRLAGSFTVA